VNDYTFPLYLGFTIKVLFLVRIINNVYDNKRIINVLSTNIVDRKGRRKEKDER